MRLIGAPPYWHGSGDVLLRVIDNDKEHKFRVHRHILSLHSVVWKDTFQLGTEPKNEVSEVDGLPIIPLDDPVRDIYSLLEAFYLGIEDLRRPSGFDAALSILRLSHKYQAKRICDDVYNLLLESWPLNRADYFSLPEGQRQRVTSSIKLIKTARTTQLTALLATAFYELAITPAEKWTEEETNLLGDLLSEDICRLFLGKNRMIQHYETSTSQLLLEATEQGTSMYRCCNDRRLLVLELEAKFGPKLFNEQLPKLRTSEYTITCETCREWIFSRLEDVEIEIWKSIPAYFDLPSVEMGEGPFVRKVFS